MGRRDRKTVEAPEGPLAPGRRRLLLALAVVVLLLGAWHRYATVVSEPGGRFEDPDAAFHAHRAARAVAERTLLPPVFDPFENFPEGGRAVWPPLHDATLAMMARLGGSTPANPTAGLGFAGAFPVLELVLVLFAAAALARRTGGDRGALLAAWLVATTPALLRRGAYGEIDHNVTEILGALALALLAGRLGDLSVRSRLLAALAWGAALLLALGFYGGLVLSAGLVAGGVLLGELVDTENPRGGPALAAGFAAAALALPLFARLRVVPDAADPWRLGPPYVFILGAAAAGSALLAILAARRAGDSRLALPLAAPAAAAGALIALLQPHGTLLGVGRGLGFLGSRDVWLSTIEEFRPLWETQETLTAVVPALPAALVALLIAALAWRKDRRRALVFLLLPAAGLLALAVVQKRFIPPAAAFGAAAAGAIFPLERRPAGRRLALLAVSALGLLVAAPRLLSFAGASLRNEPAPEVAPAEIAALALRQLTPDPGSPPAWGVLAPWDYGHQILRVGGKAVALNNYGSFHPGFARKLAIFLETSPAKAAAALDADRLRYVVDVYPPNVVPSAAATLGPDPRSLFLDGFDPIHPVRYEVTPAGERTLAVRLHLHDAGPLPGDTEADRAALRRFRLLWQTPETGPGPGGAPVPFMKIFELLPVPPSPS